MMNTVDIDRVCDGVADALEKVRSGFRSSLDRAEELDRFWCLQDHVSRLVESASDHGQETLDALRRKHPRLIQDIIEALSFTRKLHFADTSAITAAVFAINRSLEKLEYLREQTNAMAASA